MWKEVISKLRDPFPGRLILLTATPERTQPEAFYSGPECQQGAEVCGHCVVRKEAGDNLLQPIALLGNRPMHLPSQLSFDLLEFRSHAITSGLPMNEESSSACLPAKHGETQEMLDPTFLGICVLRTYVV